MTRRNINYAPQCQDDVRVRSFIKHSCFDTSVDALHAPNSNPTSAEYWKLPAAFWRIRGHNLILDLDLEVAIAQEWSAGGTNKYRDS